MLLGFYKLLLRNVRDRVMTVGLVMTVGYYRLPNWAYCENGLENQNTAPFSRVHDQFPPTLSERSKI